MAFHDPKDPPQDDESRVRKLLDEAGRPEPLPESDLEPLRRQLRAEWRSHYGRQPATRPWWRSGPVLAAAALLALAVVVATQVDRGLSPGSSPGTDGAAPGSGELLVRALAGDVRVAPTATALAVGERVAVGTVLETASPAEPGARRSHLALQTHEGVSIRLDSGTRMTVVSLTRLDLERGAVYVDSPPEAGSPITVHTPFGVARELGTRFEVRVLAPSSTAATGSVRVRVREGRVALSAAAGDRTAELGGELSVDAAGEWQEGTFPPHDPYWEWAIAAGPSFASEGRTVAQLLDWAGRELGWEIQYADPEVAATAERVTYEGGFELRPREAVEMLPGALLEGELDDGVLHISRRRAE